MGRPAMNDSDNKGMCVIHHCVDKSIEIFRHEEI